MANNEHPRCALSDRWFQCEDRMAPWVTSRSATSDTKHSFDTNITLDFFGKRVPVLVYNRELEASHSFTGSSSIEAFVLGGDVNSSGQQTIYPCGLSGSSQASGSFSDTYTVTTSSFHYIDIKNKVLCWTEVAYSYSLAKTLTESDVVYFRNAYGQEPFMHVVLENPAATGTSTLKLLIEGVESIISTVPLSFTLMEEDIHLVYPHPTCAITPAIGNPVTNFAWYDYCLTRDSHLGGSRNLEKMQLDGGDDFYYPQWVRSLDEHLGIDLWFSKDAENRYNSVWDKDLTVESTPIQIQELPLGLNILVGYTQTDTGVFLSISGDHKGQTINYHKCFIKDGPVIDLVSDVMKDIVLTEEDGNTKLFNSYNYHSFAPMGLV